MLVIFISVAAIILKVSPEVTTINTTTEPLVENLEVKAFLDENGYIRLNISWGKILYDAKHVSISFRSNEECNPINDVENYTLDDHFIIRPSMDLEHPADHIIHGCMYTVILEDKTLFKTQSTTFTVPGCVQNRCQCGNFTDSPNKLTDITHLTDHFYLLKWNTNTEENFTVHYIFYQRGDLADSTRTYIPDEGLQYRNNAIEIPMRDLKEGDSYKITVVFIDEFNDCMYETSLNYSVPSKSRASLIAVIVIVLLALLVVLYKISVWSPRVRSKLQKYLSLSKSYRPYENQDVMTAPLSQFRLREEINAQYTPLEFVLKVHKYDKYEFPRNKIILGTVIGEGAFGKVLEGKAFELGGKPGFRKVAVKQLRDGASEEETIDFQTEINMLKKIGRHENIVRLLGCVTMDQPYLMIMELITCGNLKSYLLNLRKKWSERRSSRIFFPDDMDEDWLRLNSQKMTNAQLKYTSCVFDTSDCSYIVPKPPLSADSSVFFPIKDQCPVKNLSEIAKGPETPSSMNSSRIPSSTETILTNLDTPIPLTAEINRLPEPVLDHRELQQFAIQITCGMQWLEKISITHRDLAARNILITGAKILKISDFGMSRAGLYVNPKVKKVPLRWMAIESIEDQKWDNKSDVWSFGVVLWEIGTLGAFPYEKINDLYLLPELKKGKRLERPKICTDELYALMLRCWSEKPEQRPTFHELMELLDVKRRKVYVDFDQLSPKYVFPPARALDEEDDGLKGENQ